jgi:Asp-tRNA(Asn)/Glu-tRNA(Gln) amidotransferase C subunit
MTMPLRLPTADDLKELAAASHFRLTPEELTDFQALIPGMFETLEALDQMPSAVAPLNTPIAIRARVPIRRAIRSTRSSGAAV